MNATAAPAVGAGPPAPRAVVLGGGLAGMLAAAALSAHADVTIVDRDGFPDSAAPRRGSPQARHAHLLWSGGMEAIEELVPGTLRRLLERGAHRTALPTGMVALSPHGWFRRWHESHYMVLASRDLLDWTVRESVLSRPRVTLLQRAEVLGLEGRAGRVTGARIRTAADRSVSSDPSDRSDRSDRSVLSVLSADIVVDATGRGSKATQWLARLGVSPPVQHEVNSGLAYASRVYRAPEKARTAFPVVSVQADARADGPGRSGTLLPIEGGRWLVSLSGTRGGEPSKDAGQFEAFARQLRHPIIGELLARAEPLTDVSVTRSTANRRRYFEKVPDWPDGFVVLGDAVATYNPVYGHGMSVAAKSAVTLHEVVARHGWGSPGLARRVQKAGARPVTAAWNLATGQDIFYAGATAREPSRVERAMAGFVGRLILTSTGNGHVARRVTDVMTLQRRPESLVTPSIIAAAVAGPLRRPLQGPPLTFDELVAAGL
ncbi:pyridine nucleotide-disulfide oxidoreductase [Streptomyces sp. NPDC051567]|uniref:pyridine nucleotide-disulfide oxidoreductase n=1 Tax=Streptomyces sp. NPDC051567 TaxID=3365660 RepID=UPI00379B553A